MRGERSTRINVLPEHGTAVHEAYVRLVNAGEVDWRDRAHFFALSAQIMRRILIDAARSRAAVKRGGRAARPDDLAAMDLDQVPSTDWTPRPPRFVTWTTPLKASAGSIREGQR